MGIILDSAVIIAGERGDFGLDMWLAGLVGEEIEVAGITVAELWYGYERATSALQRQRQEYIEAILAKVQVIPYTQQTAREHARLWGELRATGRMIGDYDLIIAATARERGSAVATFNIKHFAPVQGLRVIEPV